MNAVDYLLKPFTAGHRRDRRGRKAWWPARRPEPQWRQVHHPHGLQIAWSDSLPSRDRYSLDRC
jgi:hypothetical protein